PADTVRDSVEAVKGTPAAFHNECVRRVQDHLRVQFSKLSQTRYESGANHIRMVCAVSGEHNETSRTPYYWFAFHRSQLNFLSTSEKSFVCLGCGSANFTLLVPLAILQASLGSLSVTKNDTRYYWHIVIQRRAGRLALRLLGGSDGPDLTDCNVDV